MAMSVSGLGGSNLDVNGIVEQLMTVERQPLTALAKKEAGFQAQISAFGSIKSALATMQNAVAALKIPASYSPLDFYSTYKGTVADTAVATVTAGEGTVPGNYSLEVSQLAKEHRIASTANPTITPGTLTIRLGSEDGTTTTKTTSIEVTSNKLTDLRDAINTANAGVTAAVVNGAGGAQLVITGDSGGSKQFISLSGISSLEYTPGAPIPVGNDFTQQQGAQSALLKLNGIDVESQSNTVTDALAGVTLKLQKETAVGESTTLALTRDTSGLNKALEKLVSSYNDYVKLSKEMGGFNETTKKLGVLGADSALRGADTQLRQVLGSVAAGTSAGSSLRNLSDIGISIQRDGTLKLDSSKLEKAISSNFVGVANVASGIATSLHSTINGLIGTNGTIVNKTNGLNGSVKTIDLQRTSLEKRLEGTEARLRKQYTALDTLVSGMLQTSNYLQQQLANLPGVSGNS